VFPGQSNSENNYHELFNQSVYLQVEASSKKRAMLDDAGEERGNW
jgi:hypothetical protein